MFGSGVNCLAGLSWEHGCLTGIAWRIGVSRHTLVLQCSRQAANKERSVKLQCRPSEASFSGGAAR